VLFDIDNPPSEKLVFRDHATRRLVQHVLRYDTETWELTRHEADSSGVLKSDQDGHLIVVHEYRLLSVLFDDPPRCVCGIRTLMLFGCICGQMERERQC